VRLVSTASERATQAAPADRRDQAELERRTATLSCWRAEGRARILAMDATPGPATPFSRGPID